MKKIVFSLLVLLLFPLIVLAEDPKVLTLDAEANDSQISFSGTIEDGSHAVMCKLLDSDNKISDTLSISVENGSFTGELTAQKTGDYTVSCANYEGGSIKTAHVEVQVKESVEEPSEVPKTPSTLDSLLKYLILLLVSILGLSFIVFKSLKKVNN